MDNNLSEVPIASAFTPAAKKRQQRSEEQERIEAMVVEFQRQMAGMEQKLTELSMENDILVRKLQQKNDEWTSDNLDEPADDENDDDENGQSPSCGCSVTVGAQLQEKPRAIQGRRGSTRDPGPLKGAWGRRRGIASLRGSDDLKRMN